MRLWRGSCLCWLLFIAQSLWSRSCHYSAWSDDPQPYLQAIRRSGISPHPGLAAQQSVRAGIVTHHFLASGLMVRFFDALRGDVSPETIILIGPNHFHHGRGNISVSSLPWKTPFGMLRTDRPLIRQMKAEMNLHEDTEAFTGEHSVGVLVPFLKYYFPHSHVVPILIDVNAEQNQLERLRPWLEESLRNPRVLVLLSMDFSHNSTASVADSRDEEAERVISALDIKKIDELHIDCHNGLWLLLASLKSQGRVKVQINEHTNSSRLTGNALQSDVTSYFAVYFTKMTAKAASTGCSALLPCRRPYYDPAFSIARKKFRKRGD